MSELTNPEAEAHIICAALHSPTTLNQLAQTLTPDDFYTPSHEAIWDTMRAMHTQGQHVDAITIMSGLAKRSLQRFQTALIEIVDLGTVPVQAAAYANEVRELATRRRLNTAGMRMQQLASSPDETPKALTALVMAEVEHAYRPLEHSISHVGDMIDEFLDDLEDTTAPQGIAWPYTDAARVLKPMAPGQMIIIAGRPAMGKSVALADIARTAAIRDQHTTIVFSLEMRASEYLRRIIAAEAKVPLTRLQEKTLTQEEWQRIADATHLIRTAPLHIIDDPECTIADVRGKIKDLNADLVCIDYLQLGTFNTRASRREGLEEFSRGLKIAANQFGIPIVAAAQLNRGAQDQKTPRISDLRESGALEQDADVICLLHRADYEEPEHPRAGEIDVIVGKQRNGPTGLVTLCHQFHYSRFKDLAN